MDEEYQINIILSPEDQADYLMEVMGAALELIRCGKIAEAEFYLAAGLGEETEIEH